MWTYWAELDRAVDGDTIDAKVDLGFHTYMTLRLRLKGIDTPERGQPGYQEAKTYVQDTLSGDRFKISTENAGKYGRWLVDVTLENGPDLVQMMLFRELGRPYDGGKRG